MLQVFRCPKYRINGSLLTINVRKLLIKKCFRAIFFLIMLGCKKKNILICFNIK